MYQILCNIYVRTRTRKPALTLECSTSLAKLSGVKFLVDDAPPGRHPLTIAGFDDAPIAHRVGMLDLPVEGNGYGLEAAVRMLSYATGGAIVRWKVTRGGVIEHEEGRQLLRECFVRKNRMNSEAIPDPMRGYVHVLIWLVEWEDERGTRDERRRRRGERTSLQIIAKWQIHKYI